MLADIALDRLADVEQRRPTARRCRGLVVRGVSRTRVTFISYANSTSLSSTPPSIGAALDGSGVQASGMWPSPVSRPEVGSRPIQPAPGR